MTPSKPLGRCGDRYPYSDQALLAQIKLADAYFYKKKYDEAIQAYKDFEKLHPTNKAVPYCIYREGLCFYRQRSTIDRDQTYTIKALEEFRRLKQKYPKSEYVPKAEKHIAKCRLDLGEHEFYIGRNFTTGPSATRRPWTATRAWPRIILISPSRPRFRSALVNARKSWPPPTRNRSPASLPPSPTCLTPNGNSGNGVRCWPNVILSCNQKIIVGSRRLYRENQNPPKSPFAKGGL